MQAGLQALSPWQGTDSEATGSTRSSEWIWLLHDDSAPAPEALAELLAAVERAPSVSVAGCKQLDWDAPRRLIDVGLSTSRWAERLTLIEADELDQGQYDGRTDTFAVNSAGMLIRRDVWEQLEGFDPALPGTGDDVDFCWRNRLAGHRVVVVPSARMHHVRHRAHGLGTPAAARKAQVHLRLKHTAPWKLPIHAAAALLGSLFKLVLSIAVKDPGHGFTQLLATFAALGRPRAIARARRNAARTRRIHRAVIRKLQTPRREVWNHRRSLIEAIGADSSSAERYGTDLLSEQPSGDSADDFAALATTERGWAGTGALVAAGIAAVASIAGLSHLMRAESVTGGALLPVSSDLAEIWHRASSWWIGLGAGMAGHGDPFTYVLWLLGLLGGGDANGAVILLLFLAMPLAGLAAWFATGALTRRRSFRCAAALIWSAAPALQVAVDQGRLGALLAHVLIPFLALALLRATGSAVGHGRFALPAPGERRFVEMPPPKAGINGAPSWTAAAAAGLVLAVIAAGAPSLLAPLVLIVVLAGLLLGRRGRTVWWALLPAAALFVPFALSVLDRPRALLADPGVPLGFDPAPLWQQVLAQPVRFDVNGGLAGLTAFGGGGFPWALLLALMVGVPVLIVAVVALFVPGKRTRLIRAFWVAALVLLAGGWAAGHVGTGISVSNLVTPFPGAAVSAATFAFLAAAVLGGERLLALYGAAGRGTTPARSPRAARTVAAVTLVLVLAGPLAGLAAWTARSVQEPAAAPAAPAAPGPLNLGTANLLEASGAGILPATASDRGEGPEQTRTLVISTDEEGSYGASLMRGSGTTLDQLSTVASAAAIMGEPGAETIREDDEATAALRAVVATIVAGRSVDPRPALEALGAGFVVLKTDDTAAQLTASRIDAVPGLVAVGETEAGWLWRVLPLNVAVLQPADVAHRARIVDAGGATVSLLPSGLTDVDASVPEGSEGRLLVLAERVDPGWSAWLDGRKLTSTSSGWAQAFTLPATAGELTIRYQNPWASISAAAQIAVIGLTVLLAIPMPARRPNTGLSRDEGSLRKESQNA